MSKNRRAVYYHRMSEIDGALSTRETALALGVTVRTVQRFADSGELTPVYRFAGKRGAYLFDGAEVLALRDRRKRAA